MDWSFLFSNGLTLEGWGGWECPREGFKVPEQSWISQRSRSITLLSTFTLYSVTWSLSHSFNTEHFKITTFAVVSSAFLTWLQRKLLGAWDQEEAIIMSFSSKIINIIMMMTAIANHLVLSCSIAKSCQPLCYIWTAERPCSLSLTISSVQFSCSVMSDSLWPHESQHTRPPCPSPTPGVYPKPCPSNRWCQPAISSSVIPFSSCPQSFPALGSFAMSQLFAWGGQSIGVSVSASVLPMNTQDWSHLGWTGWIFLQPKGLWRVFSNTTIQNHQFFSTQLSSPSNSHVHTWLLEKL